jgi:aspartate oxidase
MVLRDVLAAAIIKEVSENRGIKTQTGRVGVWLDTPLIDIKNGNGTIRRQFPGIVHRFERYKIDLAKQPILIYPTLHYQNGGIQIDEDGRTEVKGLWASGEVTGGIHGTNRLMGNSLLDIAVFGRRAAESVQNNLPPRRPVTLTHLREFRKKLKGLNGRQSILSPQLFPTLTGMKVSFDKKTIEPLEDDFHSTSSFSVDPPDPFSK